MIGSSHDFKALSLGATLYMPIIHPHSIRALNGEPVSGARSIVLCLEDALTESDVAQGMLALESGLIKRLESGADNSACMLFVRPRSLSMARAISKMDGVGTISGFVAPKMNLETAGGWLKLSEERGISLMPTLETPDMFDPYTVSAMRAIFDKHARERIIAVRVGGNDLLGALALRRIRGRTSYESALAWPLQMISGQMMAAGYAVTSPVWEIVDDRETLIREVKEDVARGFVGKTAIHPSQIEIIHNALRPSSEEVAQAGAILDAQARAVFVMNGSMCEPATHSKWAKRIAARAHLYGVHNNI